MENTVSQFVIARTVHHVHPSTALVFAQLNLEDRSAKKLVQKGPMVRIAHKNVTA